jgi:glycosyltransferase involved in cell wall biosynthesis
VRLIIFHYHLRPGGIRRIIELATPHLLRQYDGRARRVVLATGEARDHKWNQFFRQQLGGMPVEFFIEPAFGYLSEQRGTKPALIRRIRMSLDRLLAGASGDDTIVWAHNLGIARNLLLTRELTCACEHRGVTLLAHHHDWWFDNRWLRWPEMRRFGTRTLAATASAVFPAAAHVRHFTINQADTRVLQRRFGKRVAWMPNLTECLPPPASPRARAARNWLQGKICDHGAPVWILPCRLLRRKNVAEALLLTRWLRPKAWLVTTGGVSSADEQAYADKLETATHRHHWRLRLGVLDGNEARKPSVPELLAASECVILTSMQEGFGLPYLEAAAAGRPLIARALPNIVPDLEQFGFAFPQCYDEVLVPPDLFNWEAEARRQRRFFRAWKQHLPRACRNLANEPVVLRFARQPRPVPFSRLTLTAQLEILSLPARYSLERCGPLNPFLSAWGTRAQAGCLQAAAWPARARDWLSGPAYAARWAEAVARECRKVPTAADVIATQGDFIASKLGPKYLYPLLWAKKT